ncbi:MAG: LysM peptidoglycan-binding domain-containing protein [Candidatus Electrothrix sp. GM3_4]|nr:LysM peptidoglycan-binding domain-containing protein [Candidatus Electrothrix sp. GM3_4]
MKVSLFVPLVSLPFFAACSPALHNTDPLKNINQEEVAVRSFSAKKNSEETEGVNLKKVSAPSRLAERAITESTNIGRIAAKIAANNMRRKGAGIQQAVVVYSLDLVPIVEAAVEEKEIETEILKAEEIRKARKEPRSLSLLTALKQRRSSTRKFLPASSGSAVSKKPSSFASLTALKLRSSTGKFLPASPGSAVSQEPSSFASLTALKLRSSTRKFLSASSGSAVSQEPSSFASLTALKLRSSTGKFLPASSGSAVSKDAQEVDDAPPLYIPVQSKQELKEELTALEKTGDWSNSGEGKQNTLSSYGIQCDLPKFFTPIRINLDVDFLSSVTKGKGSIQPEQPVQLEQPNKAVCDFPVIINKQVEFYLDQFQNRQRRTFRHWLKRSALYLPLIDKKLKKAELPRSLAYLAMIESGFNPAAYSPAHASGLWQFMPATARHYGLRIDSWVDERRNPEKATQAAVSYLDALYKRFGDWQLAVAAYNAGEGKIQRGLEKYKAKNFWDLAAKDYLPLETKRYVPKLIAAIIIAHDPERYGFQSVHEKNEQYDVVDVPSQTSLAAIAAAGGCLVEKIRQLNTELLKNQVPPTKGMYSIKVPAGTSTRIASNLEHIITDKERKIVHRLRKGETLSGLGERYNVSVDMIMRWNDIDDVRRIRVGRKLALYSIGKPDTRAKKSEQGLTISYYKVRNGDSLWSIARKHQVSTREIKQWNRLSNNLLHPGKKLVIKKS